MKVSDIGSNKNSAYFIDVARLTIVVLQNCSMIAGIHLFARIYVTPHPLVFTREARRDQWRVGLLHHALDLVGTSQHPSLQTNIYINQARDAHTE